MTVDEAINWVRVHGRVGRGQRYPKEVVRALGEHAVARRRAGAAWSVVEAETGVGWIQLRRWSEKAGSSGRASGLAVRPVRVMVQEPGFPRSESRPGLWLRLPGDVVVEGLTSADVVDLIRGLCR